MFTIRRVVALGFSFMLGALSGIASAASVISPDAFFDPNGRVVTEAYYPWAETARQMLNAQAAAGGVNKFAHRAALTPTDNQPVVRMNRDSYYSRAVVNVSEGATITLPDMPEGKYLSVQPVTEDHRSQPMSYGGGTYQLATHSGDHLFLILRLDSTFSPDEARHYQQQVVISAGSDEPFEAEPVERKSFVAVEAALKAKRGELLKREGPVAVGLGLFTAPTDESRAYYSPEKHQYASAAGWGGAQIRDNVYELSPMLPAEGCYQATFEDPRNGAFWSFTAYDENGFMFNDVAHVNSNLATPNADGTFTVSFGCGANAPNRIPIANDTGVFNVTVRHYRPSQRVVEGYRLVPTLKRVPGDGA